MFHTHLHTQDHFPRSSRSSYGSLFTNTTGSRATPSGEMNDTMQFGYIAGPSVHASSQEHFGMAPTRNTMAIAILYERNDYPSYDSTQNDLASNNSYTTRVASQFVPPLLSRVVPISLPPLSPNIPIQTHALITYHPSSTPVFWNISLPPSTAHIAFAIGSQGEPSRWMRDVAVMPRTLSSIAIRIRGVARPVVVFPLEAGRPIRIIDILRAVYSAMRAAALEYSAAAGNVPIYVPSSRSHDFVFEDAITADAIRSHFDNRTWWNGLLQSTTEVDVWVLHLRGPSRGKFSR